MPNAAIMSWCNGRCRLNNFAPLIMGVNKIVIYMAFRSAFLIVVLAVVPGLAMAADVTGLAMYGLPKYNEAFTHFDYVNPDAPKGGTLKLAATGTFDSLNPFIIRGNPALGLNTGFLSLVYEPLMVRSQDEPFSLYGLIAQYAEVAPDRSSMTFILNPRARWSDGKPITSDDVLFTYQTLRDKGRPNHRLYYKKVAGVDVIDAQHIRFRFKPDGQGHYDREMPMIMGLMPVLPLHDWVGRDFNQTSLRKPVGSGAYIIDSFEVGRSVTYRRNPDYWGRDLPVQRGMHNFDVIRIDYYRDDTIALQAFKAGQFDWRRESDNARWMTSYDFPAVHDGRVAMENAAHQRTEPIAGFIFNLRRALFQDGALRQALQYSFDAGWVGRNLFHGALKRSTSFFPNAELAAPSLPDAAEKAILDPYRAQLPDNIYDTPITLPTSDGSEEQTRQNLLIAQSLLQRAGYTMQHDVLLAPRTHQPVGFEILLNDPNDEKIALSWVRSLKQLGITARVHTADSAQYQARLAAFDYDVTVNKWVNSQSPGNEQLNYWGSQAADQPGSRNYTGIKDPVIDALAAAIPFSSSRDDLVEHVHALDRVLMARHIIIPFYYAGIDRLTYWKNHIRHPDQTPLYGTILESWWGQP